MQPISAKAIFLQELERALTHLYDPDFLRRSALIAWFDLEEHDAPAAALRGILLDAIAALRPEAHIPSESNAWRFYRILNYRFAEQSTQKEVAEELMLGVRQLRRYEAAAERVLAEYLWAHHGLQQRAHRLAPGASAEVAADADRQAANREAELARIATALPTEAVALCDVVNRVVETLQPHLGATSVALRCHIPDGLPPLAVQETAARQALLHLVLLAGRSAPGGRVQVEAELLAAAPEVEMRIVASRAHLVQAQHLSEADLTLARRLAQVAGGDLGLRLEASAGAPFVAELRLPIADRIPILVVDDNADTLALIQRYLAGTRYHFVGATSPQAALALAETTEPAAVILDVMLPGLDGWELLSRLRENPALAHAPIIISTILPHQDLAFTLGAAEFLPKPVSREALLRALDSATSDRRQDLDQGATARQQPRRR